MPTLKIDNREISVPAGTKVIEAAERLGIVIPRFCYHPALGSVGACRVCAVAFKEGPIKGVQMSCMVDAQKGMVISTTDAEAVDFRRHVIEFLMLNHPHDCPVCDEGGHCLLQDMTVAGGHGVRRYGGLKRTHNNQELGPLVQHEMNRCIQCYRCARYDQEVAGYRDLGAMGIGSRVYFGRSASGTLESPFAGNLIDICPTGVYTDKPSRYFGRRWDFQRRPSVCIHCSLGCNLTASARYRQVVRHEARLNPEVNGHFICDRGRYAHAYANAAERPRRAMASGKPGASADIIAGARDAIDRAVDRHGPDSVAVVASPRCSLETLAAVKQICRQKGWTGPATLTGRRQAVNLRQAVGRLTPQLAVSLAGVGQARDVLVIGADPVNEAPMLALALRQVVRGGGRVNVIDPRGVQLPFEFDHWAVHPSRMADVVRSLIAEIDGGPKKPSPAAGAADGLPIRELAWRLNSSPRPVVVCGTDIVTPSEISLAADLAQVLSRTHITVGLFYPLTGANAFAVALEDDNLPSVREILEGIQSGTIRTLVAVEADLLSGLTSGDRLASAFQTLEHLVVMDYVDSPLVRQANHFIPTQTLYECGGRWVNNEGRLQAAQMVLTGGESIATTGNGDHPPRTFENTIPGGDTQPAWQAAMALAGANADDEALQTALRQYHPAVSRLLDEASEQCIDLGAIGAKDDRSAEGTTETGGEVSPDRLTLLLVDLTFGTEPLSSMTPALESLTPPPAASMHPETMARMGLIDGRPVTLQAVEGELTLPLRADARTAEGVVVVPRNQSVDWQVFGDTRVILERSQITAENT
jgi:NADH-quinone oxidoreductase subunit G